MYIIQNKRKKKNKTYTYSFLAESRWNKDKKKSEKVILSNLSNLPQRTITTLKNILHKKEGLVGIKDIIVEKGIDYGYCFVILEIIKNLKIDQAIRNAFSKDEKDKVKYALLIILGKIITKGSKLGIVNWIKRNLEVGKELGFRKEEITKLNEKKLYSVQVDIDDIQTKIEKKWKLYHKERFKTIYLYDVTSFYFEGVQNELAQFGYNRDKKKGKKIVTAGLITDEKGFPLKIELFKGNVNDNKTVEKQIKDLKEEFNCEEIIFVGDRGMRIKYNLGNMDESLKENVSYISGLTNPEIRDLEKQGVIQMSLFDKELVEVERDDKRYILCENPQLKEEKRTLRQSLKTKFEEKLLEVQISFQREKDRCEANREKLANGDKRKRKIELTEKEVKGWEYKLRKSLEKYKMQKVYTIEIDREEETMKTEYDALAYEKLGELDGKYVFETTVKKEILDKEGIRKAYKKLQNVEHAFRDMKMSGLNLRPIFHRKEETTRAHAFLGMFSYAIIHEMESTILPWLAMERKNKGKLSFDDIIEELKMIKLCVLSFGSDEKQEIRVTKLTEIQKKILSLLGINESVLKIS